MQKYIDIQKTTYEIAFREIVSQKNIIIGCGIYFRKYIH